MQSEPPFQSSIGFLLSQLGVHATRSWTSLLASRDLTPHHHAVLLTLLHIGPTPLTQLAGAVLVDLRNLGAVLDPLEQRGLIARTGDPTDRRRRIAALTADGTREARSLASAAAGIQEQLLLPLPPSSREQLQELLATLYRHATAPDPPS